jgi:integrase
VKDLIVKIHKTAPVAANRALSYLKTFFAWCVEEEILEHSPVAIMRPLGKEIARDRVLNNEEIRAVWQAAEELGTVGRAIRFLLVTGQRRGEVGGMRWSEIDLQKRTWTLPKERTKAARAHEVPLSDLAVSLIGVCSGSQHVFPPPFSWHRGKSALPTLATGWRLHDLRRTCATNLVGVGVDRIVISKLLNHAEGGVRSVYDRHPRAEEKRAAMDRWGARLAAIVEGGDDNVVPIRRGS